VVARVSAFQFSWGRRTIGQFALPEIDSNNPIAMAHGKS
jgi:hypothetical protein